MAVRSDARRVVVLQPGDVGYDTARKIYIQDPNSPSWVGGRRFEAGSGAGFEAAWRVKESVDPTTSRKGYYVDSAGNPIVVGGGNLTYAQMGAYGTHTYST